MQGSGDDLVAQRLGPAGLAVFSVPSWFSAGPALLATAAQVPSSHTPPDNPIQE